MTVQRVPQPPPNFPWIDPDGKPSLSFRQYMLALDQMLRSPVQIAAPNNANAAAANVPVGGIYTSTSDPHILYIRTA
jgi:hypothetical protein